MDLLIFNRPNLPSQIHCESLDLKRLAGYGRNFGSRRDDDFLFIALKAEVTSTLKEQSMTPQSFDVPFSIRFSCRSQPIQIHINLTDDRHRISDLAPAARAERPLKRL
ncbi:hypothetical protein EVAR_96115_1 [Eumeta japonica]|uniref:Uncharacterized protein n=1 Tax=Eumeta variegata TaxID=151549 RepID=A0A4C1VCJ1_EUMVA|nr:hypothetical protein EVAR_96115_1 [Eumeta japonica]